MTARCAHNAEAAGYNPAPATNFVSARTPTGGTVDLVKLGRSLTAFGCLKNISWRLFYGGSLVQGYLGINPCANHLSAVRLAVVTLMSSPS